jgi:hypothetical protein
LKSTRNSVLFAALGLAVLGGVSQANADDLDLQQRVKELEATAAHKGDRKVSLTISGQASTGVMAWDAGGSSPIVDSGPGFGSSTKINQNPTTGLNITTGRSR